MIPLVGAWQNLDGFAWVSLVKGREDLSLGAVCLRCVAPRYDKKEGKEVLGADRDCGVCNGRGTVAPRRTERDVLALASRGSLSAGELTDLAALNRLAALGVPW